MNEKFNNLIDKNKIYTDYLSGIFATLLATPCSAPFLGTAVGFSMIGSSETILIIFFLFQLDFLIALSFMFFFSRI